MKIKTQFMDYATPILVFLAFVALLLYFGFRQYFIRFPDTKLPEWDKSKMRYFGALTIPQDFWFFLLQEAPEDAICWLRDKSHYYQNELAPFKKDAYDWFEKIAKENGALIHLLQFRLWLTAANRRKLAAIMPDHSLSETCIYDAETVLFYMLFDEKKGYYEMYVSPELGAAALMFFTERFSDRVAEN